VVVCNSWEIHHHDVVGTDVVVGVPDIDWDIDEAPIVFGEHDAAHLSVGGASRAGIEQD
jgi:hypothetical protein